MDGKETCRILTQLRREIAASNGIELSIEECRYKGECTGTCPRCEAEVLALEAAIRAKGESVGKVKFTPPPMPLAGVMIPRDYTPPKKKMTLKDRIRAFFSRKGK